MSAGPDAQPGRRPRLLVVEDEAIVAMLLEDMLRLLGADIVGPVASVAAALQLVEAEVGRLDGAVLDVNLGIEPVYPVAERLAGLAIPFAFITGYGVSGIDPHYADHPVLEKPFELGDVEQLVVRHFAPTARD